MDWKRMLAHVTGTVDQELLARNEYLLAENRILRGQIKGTVRLDDTNRRTLAEIGIRLGRRARVVTVMRGLPGRLLDDLDDEVPEIVAVGEPAVVAEVPAIVVDLGDASDGLVLIHIVRGVGDGAGLCARQKTRGC